MNHHQLQTAQQGFTLIELMLVAAVIGLLAAIALPAYQDYIIRSRITEGLALAQSAKIIIATDGIANLTDLNNSATSWNNQGANSKYVTSVLIDRATGIIEVTFNHLTVGLTPGQNKIQLAPWVRDTGAPVAFATALAAATPSSVDWVCVSATAITAANQGMPTPDLGATGVIANYVPAPCR